MYNCNKVVAKKSTDQGIKEMSLSRIEKLRRVPSPSFKNIDMSTWAEKNKFAREGSCKMGLCNFQ
jgi:hypothetical protein